MWKQSRSILAQLVLTQPLVLEGPYTEEKEGE